MYLLSVNGVLQLVSSRSSLIAAIRSLDPSIRYSVFWSLESVGSSEAFFHKLNKCQLRSRFPELIESGDL